MTEDAPTKTCPDCAETVLEAARKCRFCGYRFDGRADRVAGQGSDGGIMSLIRRPPPPPMTEIDLLDSWGVEVGDEEGQGALCHGTIEGRLGFIVVTQTHLRFIPARRPKGTPAVFEEHLLSDLLRVHRARHRMRRALFLEWRATRTIVQIEGTQLQRLEELLEPHAITG